MCTLVILRRANHPWPLLLAANRDEHENRPWQPPARHWDDREDITAGLDELAGGTWLGVSNRGMVAAVLNRPGTLGPAKGKRSRGELPLEALDHESPSAAVEALKHLDPTAYRPFNLVIADATEAYWLAAREQATKLHIEPIPLGLSMLTAEDLNDGEKSPRVRLHLPKFKAATIPDPDTKDWSAWQACLSSPEQASESAPFSAMCFSSGSGFGTRSSSLIALPRPQFPLPSPIWKFCHGAPSSKRWTDVNF